MSKTLKIIKGDRRIVIVVAILMLISALMMGSTLTKMAMESSNFNFRFLTRQLFFSGIGFILMIILSQIPYQIYSKLAQLILITAVILVIMTVLFGENTNNAKRWMVIPVIGIKFQTSDFVKFAIVIYISKIISEFDFIRGNVKEMLKKVLIPTLGLTLITSFNDLSTAALMFVTIFAILFVTPIDKKIYFKIATIISFAGVAFIVFSMATGLFRGETWKNRLLNNTNGYDQKLEAKIAISNGGFIIKPGKSKQKHLIENSYSDYVFAVYAEEYGILGIIVLIGLYLIFMYRIVLIIKRQKRSFPMFLTIGIAINILFQTFIHILVNVGILPVTGQPLPLVSHGGTSMIITASQIGIILNISQIGTSEETVRKRTSKTNKNEPYNDDKNQPKDKEQEIEINDYPFLIG